MGSVDGYGDPLEGALNYDSSDATFVYPCIEVIADSFVLNYFCSVILASEPVGFPTSDDSQAIADWICLLTHMMV